MRTYRSVRHLTGTCTLFRGYSFMKTLIPLLFVACLASSPVFAQRADNSRESMQERRAALLKRFPEADTNSDGVLSTRELAAHMEKLRNSPETKARMERTLKRLPQADANEDGILTSQELRTYLANNPQMTRDRNRTNRKVNAPVPDVAYGDHERQRFDLWPLPDAEKPTPLVVFIHGGGFRGGDKSLAKASTIEACQKAGIAFAVVNYRLSDSGTYPIMMHDAARAIQTIRHRAEEWNIDPERIICFGGSAGAGISLWLAFHDDLADPDSDDPIARESTRILAAAALNGQSAYDMHKFREWFGVHNLQVGRGLPPFLGIEDLSEFDDPRIRTTMQDASPITHLSEDDTAEVYMFYSRPYTEVTEETDSAVWVHHVLLGLKLQEAMQKLGLKCTVTAPDMQDDLPYESLEDFLIEKATGHAENQ